MLHHQHGKPIDLFAIEAAMIVFAQLPMRVTTRARSGRTFVTIG
jgi:hypothetical protein